ncbi:MAG: FMN-binding glutamate synthase family protein [Sulfolobus sp.]|nr:FMN-binding glutamate synthase family protein [Sulfolobus sp.]
MLISNKYIQVPSKDYESFWTLEKIEHIRKLALTGKPQKIFDENLTSLRILDRITFKDHKNEITEEPQSRTDIIINGIYMSTPLYLGDMSYGALSGNPNIAIVRAAELTNTLAGTGEGGLHPEIAKYKRFFVQWASARFGVDIGTLMAGIGIVIKIGQGAKPGIGGHLPGSKVTEPISVLRRIPKGIDALSPAPHHDIYSIEDLGQRIEALKEATGKPVYVKVAATNYIPYIVSGIARMKANGVIIDGHGAGTGATPFVVRDNVGIPVELAVASADNILRREGLRDNFTIIAAGRVSSATDAAKLIALGADVVSIGTAALLAMGCIQCDKCHIGYCPTSLTNKIDGTRILDLDFGTRGLVNFIRGFTLELANILDNLGLRSIKELKGRRDLLFGNNLDEETLKILGIEGTPYEQEVKMGELWDRERLSYLHELVNKGDAVIVSMGSNAPPDVKKPARILDWLRSDGAQVTRPSIDPYREDIDTSFYLNQGKVYLSLPLIIDVTNLDRELKKMWGWVALATSTMIFDMNALQNYEEVSFSKDDKGILTWSTTPHYDKYLLLPSDSYRLNDITDRKVSGFIIDEYIGNDDIELVVSDIDTKLKDLGTRNYYDLIVKSRNLRDSADIFKLLLLGADAVILPGDIIFKVINTNVSKKEDIKEKAFNLIVGFKKELSLLAGASGVYSIQSTIVGNRELLRAVNLSSKVREVLRVKPAGSL